MPDNALAEKTRESQEATRSLGEQKDLGENDASFVDTFSNVAEKVADSIAHKLHPMVEQYATTCLVLWPSPLSRVEHPKPATYS